MQSQWQHLYEQYQKMLSEQKQILFRLKVAVSAPVRTWYVYALDPEKEEIYLARLDDGLIGKLEGEMFVEGAIYVHSFFDGDILSEIAGKLENPEEWQKVRFIRVYDEEIPQSNDESDFLRIMTEDAYIRSNALNATYLQLPKRGKFVLDYSGPF